MTDKPKRPRAKAKGWLVIDEYSHITPEQWRKFIRPLLRPGGVVRGPYRSTNFYNRWLKHLEKEKG